MSTKIHAAGDALGNPVRLLASLGQRNHIALAHDLIASFEPGAVLGDKGCDADSLAEAIDTSGAVVVIPPKRLKQFRRIVTRYDKLLANFMGFVKLAAIAIWLR